MTLTTRIEQAGEGEQRELLIEAALALADDSWPVSKAARFYDMVDAEAYLSAAEMLLGGKRLLCLTDLAEDGWAAKLWKQPAASGKTPALALLSAILKAGESG